MLVYTEIGVIAGYTLTGAIVVYTEIGVIVVCLNKSSSSMHGGTLNPKP